MLDLGDWQLGQEFPIVVQTTDGVSPAWPDQAPQLCLFSGSTLIRRVLIPADSQCQIPGLFRYPLFLGDAFAAAATINGFVQWVNGGNAFAVPLFFRIIPGGNTTGQIIAMTFIKRPSSGAIVYQVDSEMILKATNPRVIR